jgi:hypothetical protein
VDIKSNMKAKLTSYKHSVRNPGTIAVRARPIAEAIYAIAAVDGTALNVVRVIWATANKT